MKLIADRSRADPDWEGSYHAKRNTRQSSPLSCAKSSLAREPQSAQTRHETLIGSVAICGCGESVAEVSGGGAGELGSFSRFEATGRGNTNALQIDVWDIVVIHRLRKGKQC